MQFFAKINPNFEAYHLFKKTNTLKGLVSGVLFKKSGHDYVSEILTADQITSLIGNSGIILEAVGTLPEALSYYSFDEKQESPPLIDNTDNIKKEDDITIDKPVVMKMKPEESNANQEKKNRGRPKSR